jgi:hypothetical protein
MGCAEAVVPADGAAAVAAPMGGRGADLVLEMVRLGLGRIGALYYRSSTFYQIFTNIFGASFSETDNATEP